MFTPNQIIQKGQYVIKKQLSDSSETYEALETKTGKEVFVKEFSEGRAGKRIGKAEFEARAKILSDLQSYYILPVVNSFTEKNRNFLVYELADSENFGTILQRIDRPLPIKDLKKWLLQLVEVMALLHVQNPPLTNLNLHPSNIYLTSSGNIKLRISQFEESVDLKRETDTQNLEGEILSYLAFEEIWKKLDLPSKKVILNSFDSDFEKSVKNSADAQTDIYSLGATAYHLATGKMPPDSLTRLIDIIEGKPDPLPPAHEINPKIEPEYSEVLSRVLAIKREDRPPAISFVKQMLCVAEMKVQEKLQQTVSTPQVKLPDSRKLSEMPRPEKGVVAEIKPSASLNGVFKPVTPINNAPVNVAPTPVSISSASPTTPPTNQLDSLKKQLLEAERRAVEAEKRLSQIENGKQNSVGSDAFGLPAPVLVSPNVSVQKVEKENSQLPVTSVKTLNVEMIIPEIKSEINSEIPASAVTDVNVNPLPVAQSESSEINSESAAVIDDFDLLSYEYERKKSPLKKMAVGAGLLALVGGMGFGVWAYIQQNGFENSTNESQVVQTNISTTPSVETQPTPVLEIPQPTEENPIKAETNSKPENLATTAAPAENETKVASSETEKTNTSAAKEKTAQQSVKPKPTPTQVPQIAKKETAKPADKKEAPKKKSVTLDELLNDN